MNNLNSTINILVNFAILIDETVMTPLHIKKDVVGNKKPSGKSKSTRTVLLLVVFLQFFSRLELPTVA